MQKLVITSDERIEAKFLSYPAHIRTKLFELRTLIIEAAQESEAVKEIEETLKWGEPSYLCKTGSTIRINQVKNTTDRYAVYFQCTSKLVPTFKSVFGDTFQYDKNRAILFHTEDELPKEALKHCFKTALQYHKLKNLALLGL